MASNLDDDRAVALICQGTRSEVGSPERHEEEALIYSYFRSFTSDRLDEELARLDGALETTEPGDRRDACKLLVAYFDWALRTGVTAVPCARDGSRRDLKDLALSFTQILVARLYGFPNSKSWRQDAPLRRWATPDTALGWTPRVGRPPVDELRDLSIAAYVHRQLLRDKTVTAAQMAAVSHFQESIDVVDKAARAESSLLASILDHPRHRKRDFEIKKKPWTDEDMQRARFAVEKALDTLVDLYPVPETASREN